MLRAAPTEVEQLWASHPNGPVMKCATAARAYATGPDGVALPLAVQARHGHAFMGVQQRLFHKSVRKEIRPR
jgi:hypothetical protein